jgi:peptidoglycan/xylan/chitin deacetylase (PgdA/CDA1 family)
MTTITLTFDNGPDPDVTPLVLAAEPGAAASEIARTRELIGNLTHPRRFFRPFGNGGVIDRSLLNEEAVEHLTRGGYTCVLWNVIPRDWALPNGWVERALEMCDALPEALVVLHDLLTGAMSGLDRFIGAARASG